MKRYIATAASAALVLATVRCGDGRHPTDPDPGAVPDHAYSGGALTVFASTVGAYSIPAPVASDLELHLAGDVLAETGRVAGTTALYGGLGPAYNAVACASCHQSDGRTISDLWRYRGTGPSESNFLVRISTAAGDPVPGYGTVIQDQAIFGYAREARTTVFYALEPGAYADGTPYELARPLYTFSDWYGGAPPSDFVYSVRIPLRQVGLGLLRAIDDTAIERLAAEQPAPISGRPNYTVDPYGEPGIGRFGHKAQGVTLDVERTFLSDIGLTSDGFPVEPLAERSPDVPDSILHHPPDISVDDMNAVDFYFHTLGVPARRDLDDPSVIEGERLFAEAGCALCHMPTLRTGPGLVTTLGGTPVPELRDQVIHPYTDLLLHDMGADLADDYRQGSAEGYEWRTTPLWGIGLQKLINGNTFFLHDGRARNLEEAILWHGGEAENSRERFTAMSKEERVFLLRFLESL